MKKYYKLATLIIVLCMCFAITGCFENKKEKMANTNTKAIKTECKSNLKILA